MTGIEGKQGTGAVYRFRPKSVELSVMREDDVRDYETPRGTLRSHTQDWLVTMPNGQLVPVDPETFREMYEPVDDTAKAALER